MSPRMDSGARARIALGPSRKVPTTPMQLDPPPRLVPDPRAPLFRITRDAVTKSVRLLPSSRTALELPLEEGNYYQGQVAVFREHLVPLCCAPTLTRGRLALLDGPPGGGKTYLARALLHAAQVPFVRTDPATFLALTEDDLASLAATLSGPKVLFIEDADPVIQQRTEETHGTLANLLNLGDGMLGLETDWRVVMTTNMAYDEVDTAVKRNGRMGARVHCSTLVAPLADAVHKRLTGGKPLPALRAMMLAEVYATAMRTGMVPR